MHRKNFGHFPQAAEYSWLVMKVDFYTLLVRCPTWEKGSNFIQNASSPGHWPASKDKNIESSHQPLGVKRQRLDKNSFFYVPNSMAPMYALELSPIYGKDGALKPGAFCFAQGKRHTTGKRGWISYLRWCLVMGTFRSGSLKNFDATAMI